MTSPPPARARFSLVLDGLTLLVLCGAVVVFFTNRRGTPAPNSSSAAVLDSSFAPLEVVDSAGHSTLLAPASGRRGLLLFVFKSDCPACALQKPEWLRLAFRARERNIQVIAVTLEEITDAVRGYWGPDVPAAQIADPAGALKSLQISVVPATILVTDRGRIAFHAMGVLDQPRLRVLEGLL